MEKLNDVLKRLETSNSTADLEKMSELIKVKTNAYIVVNRFIDT